MSRGYFAPAKQGWGGCTSTGLRYVVRWERVGDATGWVATSVTGEYLTGAWTTKAQVRAALEAQR